MIYKTNKLRGRIVEQYGSINNFCLKNEINRTTFSQKLNNRLGISRDEIVSICSMLDIPIDEIPAYFFQVE